MTKILIDKETVELALDALEDLGMRHYERTDEILYKELFTVLRQALEQSTEQEPVAFEMDWPEFHQKAMGCGLEDRNITDRYEAMQYGWEEALDRCAERLPEILYTQPQEAAPHKPLTDEMVTLGAKALAKRHADSCGLDFDDVWKYYSDDHKDDARAVLIAAHGIGEKEMKEGVVIDKAAAVRIATSIGWEPKREWVGLTEQEHNDLEDYCEMIIGKPAFEAIEAKLKEKNA